MFASLWPAQISVVIIPTQNLLSFMKVTQINPRAPVNIAGGAGGRALGKMVVFCRGSCDFEGRENSAAVLFGGQLQVAEFSAGF